MKIAAAILNRFAKTKTDAPDAFDLRLANMGVEPDRRDTPSVPMLFHRPRRAAA